MISKISISESRSARARGRKVREQEGGKASVVVATLMRVRQLELAGQAGLLVHCVYQSGGNRRARSIGCSVCISSR